MTLRLELPVNPNGGVENVGPTGSTGPAGPGLPTGGAAGTAAVKQSGTNYDTAWVDVFTQAEQTTFFDDVLVPMFSQALGGLETRIDGVEARVLVTEVAIGDHETRIDALETP